MRSLSLNKSFTIAKISRSKLNNVKRYLWINEKYALDEWNLKRGVLSTSPADEWAKRIESYNYE